MARTCIICGRPLKTGRKYCYTCRSQQHVQGLSNTKFPKWLIIWLIFWIVLSVIFLKYFPTIITSKEGTIFIWIIGILTIILSIIYFGLIKKQKEK